MMSFTLIVLTFYMLSLGVQENNVMCFEFELGIFAGHNPLLSFTLLEGSSFFRGCNLKRICTINHHRLVQVLKLIKFI